MARSFAHPVNGYTEKVGGSAVLLTVLLGPFYLAYRGAWSAALAWVVLAPTAFWVAFSYMPGPLTSLVLTILLFIALAFAIRPLIAKSYLRRGWREVTA